MNTPENHNFDFVTEQQTDVGEDLAPVMADADLEAIAGGVLYDADHAW